MEASSGTIPQEMKIPSQKDRRESAWNKLLSLPVLTCGRLPLLKADYRSRRSRGHALPPVCVCHASAHDPLQIVDGRRARVDRHIASGHSGFRQIVQALFLHPVARQTVRYADVLRELANGLHGELSCVA